MWACRVRRYRAWSPVLLVVLAPLLWYWAGLATGGWVWFFFGLSMATAASAAVLGWWYRSGPFGW